MDMYIIDAILITTRRKYFIFDLFNIYTKKEVKHPHVFFEMTNYTSITRLQTRKSQERNGDLLGHYIGCTKPQKKIKKNVNSMNI